MIRFHHSIRQFSLLPTALIILSGCSSDKADSVFGDTSQPHIESPGEDTGNPKKCEDMDVKAQLNGDLRSTSIDDIESPRVGDNWRLQVFCEGSPVLGATVLTISPPTRATTDNEDTALTFIEDGNATIDIQAGNKKASYNVEILPAL